MKLLVTGGNGFVGSNLCRHFKGLGWDVTSFDNLVRRGSELNIPIYKKLGIKFVHGDVRNAEDFVQLKENFDVICECSAQPSATEGYLNPIFDITNNTIGAMNALEHARKTGATFIFWSTNKVYSGDKINRIPLIESAKRWEHDIQKIQLNQSPEGYLDYNWAMNGISESFSIDGNQHSIYGLSKAMSDLMVQEWSDAYGVKTVINRFSCLAGRGQFGLCQQGWVAWFVVAAHFGLPLTLYGWKGKQVRDILDVRDVCSLVETEVKHIDHIKGQVFNVGGGSKNSLSLLEAIEIVENITGKKIEYSINGQVRKADQCIYVSNISKVKKSIPWVPMHSYTACFEDIYTWVKENEGNLKELYL